jgi:hypothetical protein
LPNNDDDLQRVESFIAALERTCSQLSRLQAGTRRGGPRCGFALDSAARRAWLADVVGSGVLADRDAAGPY